MHLIGLTGGIASGKSTVSAELEKLGCPIIDADVIAREGEWNWLKILFELHAHTLQHFMSSLYAVN